MEVILTQIHDALHAGYLEREKLLTLKAHGY